MFVKVNLAGENTSQNKLYVIFGRYVKVIGHTQKKITNKYHDKFYNMNENLVIFFTKLFCDINLRKYKSKSININAEFVPIT